MANENFPTPAQGLITWENEGQEGGTFHSRKLHVPGDTSGATLGRGYDMKSRTKTSIEKDLIDVGVEASMAKKISECAGKSGATAKTHIKNNGLADFEITPEAQQKLFELEYVRVEADARRLCTKADVVEKYGACNWNQIDKPIQELIVDLRYRGDYTGATRAIIQKAIITNDYEALIKSFSNKAIWGNIDTNRFNSRLIHLKNNAVQKKYQVIPTKSKFELMCLR